MPFSSVSADTATTTKAPGEISGIADQSAGLVAAVSRDVDRRGNQRRCLASATPDSISACANRPRNGDHPFCPAPWARRSGAAGSSCRVATKGRSVNADAAAASVTAWESWACRRSACRAARTTLRERARIETGAPAGGHDGRRHFLPRVARARSRSG